MNGIFIFPIVMSLFSECSKIFKKTTPDFPDGEVYQPYENEKTRLQRKQAQTRHKLASIAYFVAVLLAAGGFGYIMFLVI